MSPTRKLRVPKDKYHFLERTGREVIADANGEGSIFFVGPRVGQSWKVGRLIVTAAVNATVNVYVGSPFPNNLVDFTVINTATGVSDEFSPIYVEPRQRLTIAFSGVPAGTVCKATIQTEVIKEGL